jgi:hypothetical protein
MDYQNKENEIVEFIGNNFNKYLIENSNPVEHFINEFLDLDQYNYNASVWFDFDSYNYQELTNESRLETCNMRIFIVVRNETEKKLHKYLRDYTSTLYGLFEKTGYNFGGIADYGLITDIRFYGAVEGDKNKKLSEVTFTLVRETI